MCVPGGSWRSAASFSAASGGGAADLDNARVVGNQGAPQNVSGVSRESHQYRNVGANKYLAPINYVYP